MRRTAVLLAALLGALPVAGQSFMPDSAFLAAFRWRSVGPANMGGRVHDIEANPANPKVIYVGFATGGLWRSDNAGTTWTPLFDATGVHAVSDIAIAPSDTSVLWVGTGEVNSRNSISPGAGIFHSVDRGATWTYAGLRETQHIARVLVHPTDPNTVWVAALGRAWGSNPERGIFKTTDGGTTWRRTLAPGAAGSIDLAMDPRNPAVLLAATWERVRGPWYMRSGGPGSGLWRSADGGETWTRATAGLPTTTLGRIGVAFAPSNSAIAYAIVEADSNPNPASLRRGFVPDTAARQSLQSGLFRSTDGGQTWARMNNENNRPFYYSQVRVDPRNADRVYWISTQARFSNDGGATYRQVGQGIHVDYHALWINPNDPEHYIIGQDGGVAQTFDRGRTYDAILQMAVGQFYAVGLDMQRPFWVCGGLQDNGTWCGPSESPRGAIRNEDWINVSGGDGFYALIDPTDPNTVYSESQGGNIGRMDLRTWQRENIRPGGGGFGGGARVRALRDSLIEIRRDTTVPATPAQRARLASIEAQIAADTATLSRNRFNWQAPFLLSAHNPGIVYMGGQLVWKSVNRGDDWSAISGDLSTTDRERVRISMATTGGITRDATGAETHGTVTTLAESPARPGILWAGTDDGNVWLTRNDGAAWENITRRILGVPAGLWVSRVEASPVDSATVYVTFDGHRSDDFRPWVFVSTDFGRTFRTITSGIPANEYVHVIRVHPRRPDLLFLGTERTAYISTDRGAAWRPFNGDLPPAPVHDLVIHPRDGTLVAATHGRSIWIVDIGPLETATDSVLTAAAHLFPIEPALLYQPRAGGGGVGARGAKHFQASNPPFGARIPLRIVAGAALVARRPGGPGGEAGPEGEGGEGGPGGFGGGPGGGAGGALAALLRGEGRPAGDTLEIVITDAAGDTVRRLNTNARIAALRWITWDLRGERAPQSPSQVRDSITGAVRRGVLRDSLRTLMRDTTGARPQMTDPERGEPGQWQNPLLRTFQLGGGGGGGGGGGFGGQGAFVEPGTYVVSIRLNGVTYRRAFEVVRPDQTSALSGGWK